MVALGLIFTALMSKMQLPGRLPGVLVAVLLGTGIHFALGFGGYLPEFIAPTLAMNFSLPVFSIEFLKTLPHSIQYLSIAIPFGILTIIGGINNTESARLAGDDYCTRDILLTEAFSSLIAAFFGGVAQTTPYIGHPAYKKMGATLWYTLLTGILIGVCSVVGLLSLFVSLIPRAVIAPIFIFIGFEIMRQAYNDSPPKHSPAVSLSILPVIASLVLIILCQFMGAMGATPDKLPVRLQTMHQTLTMLSNGFIITGLLWGSMLAFLIDHKAKLAALCTAVCAVLTLFGIIHSLMPTGELYLPWQITTHAHYMTATAYFVLSGILLLLTGKQNESKL